MGLQQFKIDTNTALSVYNTVQNIKLQRNTDKIIYTGINQNGKI